MNLNRTVLARQQLLQRSTLPLHRVVERMAGIQAQYAPSPYIGLWARVEGFKRPQLTAALERGSLVQATLMRQTIHIVSKADFWPMGEATRSQRQDAWLRTWKDRDRGHYEELAKRLVALLSDGPMKRKEIVAALGIDSEQWGGVMNWVDMVRVPPSGTWDSRRADLFGLADSWVGPRSSDQSPGTDLLIRRYLTGFGPASVKDIRAFTLLSRERILESLDRVSARPVDEDLFDVRGGLIVEDAPAPVRFVGHWDATLLVHCRRAEIVPEEYRPAIFNTRAPHSFATFLVDGQVRGTWKEIDGKVELDRFEPIPRRFGRELADEKQRLETWLAT